MHPEKYREELSYLERKGRALSLFGFFSAFLASYIVAGPLIHEGAHMATLYLTGCDFSYSLGFNLFTGLTGTVDPACSLNSSREIIFQLSGYLTSILLGVLAFLLSLRTGGGGSVDISSGFGTGLFVSAVSTVGLRGDIHRASELAGMEKYSGSIEMLIILTLLLTAFYFLERKLQKGRNGADTNP